MKALLISLSERVRAFELDVSVRDVHIYGGLALGFLGGAQASVPWTCVIVGALLLLIGIFQPGS